MNSVNHIFINSLRLTEKFAKCFESYEMICYYCGEAMTDTNLNSTCFRNSTIIS